MVSSLVDVVIGIPSEGMEAYYYVAKTVLGVAVISMVFRLLFWMWIGW